MSFSATNPPFPVWFQAPEQPPQTTHPPVAGLSSGGDGASEPPPAGPPPGGQPDEPEPVRRFSGRMIAIAMVITLVLCLALLVGGRIIEQTRLGGPLPTETPSQSTSSLPIIMLEAGAGSDWMDGFPVLETHLSVVC